MAEVLKYSVLKQLIADRIEDSTYEVGTMIPSEREFMDTFRVSRTTVRKAIEDLEKEGFLYRIQGKGTYVKSKESEYDLFSLTSCTEDILKRGKAVNRKVLAQEIVPAGKELARHLQVAADERILRLERVYYADSTPLNITCTHIPSYLFPGIERFNFRDDSLYRVLRGEYGVEITHARRTLQAVLSDAKISAHLEIPLGTPLILFTCSTFGRVHGSEKIIEHFHCHYRTDKHQFYIDQVRR